MGLEIPTNKTPGDVARVTEAPRPAIIGWAILALTALELVFAYLIFYAINNGYNSPTKVTTAVANAPFGAILKSDQQIVAIWLAGLFYCLALIIFLYQRFFMDHVTIYKRRFKKLEDEGVL